MATIQDSTEFKANIWPGASSYYVFILVAVSFALGMFLTTLIC